MRRVYQQLKMASQEITAQRGKRRIGAMTSDERGESVTCVVCTSATGMFVPQCQYIMQGSH